MSNSGNTITINGGTLTAEGSSLGGTRRVIFSHGMYGGNTITINDGEFNATHPVIEGVSNSSYPKSYLIAFHGIDDVTDDL